MLHRILPALSLLALAGCQPYYSGANGYGPSYGSARGPASAGDTVPGAIKPYSPFSPTQAASSGGAVLTPAVFTPTPSAKPPPALPGGVFHEIDPHGGDVGFWNQDPVAKRETATYADRYVERISLRSGGVITYEMLNHGTFSDESDAALIQADLDLPPFRARGIRFDPGKLGQVGPFTYLAQSSASDNCFIFRGKFGGTSGAATEDAYGNVCYARQVRNLDAIKAEMVDLLTHARFGQPAAATLAAAAPEAAKPAAAAPLSAAAPSPTVNLDRCRSAVSFSAVPAAGGKDQPGKFSYAEGSYSEEASCSCKPDVDYAKLSQFDAVDNVRHLVEARGFKLQKATFGETPELGKELAFEAMAEKEGGEAFLLGRNFYGQCGLSVVTSGISYAELRKARKFVESVAAIEPTPAAPEASTAVSDAAVTSGGPEGQADTPPAAAPLTPVAKAEPAPAATTTLAAAKPAEDAPAHADSGSTAAPDAAQPAVDETAQRLRRLKMLQDQKLITPDEYQTKREAILKSL